MSGNPKYFLACNYLSQLHTFLWLGTIGNTIFFKLKYVSENKSWSTWLRKGLKMKGFFMNQFPDWLSFQSLETSKASPLPTPRPLPLKSSGCCLAQPSPPSSTNIFQIILKDGLPSPNSSLASLIQAGTVTPSHNWLKMRSISSV